jgi:uncharacterized membrane protein
MYTLLVIAVLFLVLDLLMIGFINRDMYQEIIQMMNGTGIQFTAKTYIGIGLAYLFLTLGLYWVLQKSQKSDNYLETGLLFGLIVYGVFDATLLVMLNAYPLSSACIDIAWGTVLCGTIAAIVGQMEKMK